MFASIRNVNPMRRQFGDLQNLPQDLRMGFRHSSLWICGMSWKKAIFLTTQTLFFSRFFLSIRWQVLWVWHDIWLSSRQLMKELNTYYCTLCLCQCLFCIQKLLEKETFLLKLALSCFLSTRICCEILLHSSNTWRYQ